MAALVYIAACRVANPARETLLEKTQTCVIFLASETHTKHKFHSKSVRKPIGADELNPEGFCLTSKVDVSLAFWR